MKSFQSSMNSKDELYNHIVKCAGVLSAGKLGTDCYDEPSFGVETLAWLLGICFCHDDLHVAFNDTKCHKGPEHAENI